MKNKKFLYVVLSFFSASVMLEMHSAGQGQYFDNFSNAAYQYGWVHGSVDAGRMDRLHETNQFYAYEDMKNGAMSAALQGASYAGGQIAVMKLVEGADTVAQGISGTLQGAGNLARDAYLRRYKPGVYAAEQKTMIQAQQALQEKIDAQKTVAAMQLGMLSNTVRNGELANVTLESELLSKYSTIYAKIKELVDQGNPHETHLINQCKAHLLIASAAGFQDMHKTINPAAFMQKQHAYTVPSATQNSSQQKIASADSEIQQNN